MFKKLLVAFDGSDHSELALKAACELAQKLSAGLDVIHIPQVVEDAIAIGYSVVPIPASAEQVKKASDEVLSRAKEIATKYKIADPGFEFEQGDPGRVIVDYAKRNDVDLIVMGRRGLGHLGGLLMGSTTNRVSQLADCAVLTVK